MSDLAGIRRDFSRASLDISDTDPDPLIQFHRWMTEARMAESLEPTAMTLATADAAGRPSARIVLLKEATDQGFVFFGDRRSRKGRELAANPHAALCFWWSELQRQVRIAGPVYALGADRSAAYFQTRPRQSQISAWASHQSAVVTDRAALDASWASLEEKFAGQEVPLPPHWGGFCLVPEEFEFWQGRPGRFHDRIHYDRGPDGSWRRERLSP